MHTAVVRIVLCVWNDKLPGSTLVGWKIVLYDTMQHGLSLLLLQPSNNHNCMSKDINKTLSVQPGYLFAEIECSLFGIAAILSVSTSMVNDCKKCVSHPGLDIVAKIIYTVDKG